MLTQFQVGHRYDASFLQMHEPIEIIYRQGDRVTWRWLTDYNPHKTKVNFECLNGEIYEYMTIPSPNNQYKLNAAAISEITKEDK